MHIHIHTHMFPLMNSHTHAYARAHELRTLLAVLSPLIPETTVSVVPYPPFIPTALCFPRLGMTLVSARYHPTEAMRQRPVFSSCFFQPLFLFLFPFGLSSLSHLPFPAIFFFLQRVFEFCFVSGTSTMWMDSDHGWIMTHRGSIEVR